VISAVISASKERILTSSGDETAREAEWNQLTSWIQANPTGDAVIVAGDTNSRYTRTADDLAGFVANNGLTDAWVQLELGGTAPAAGSPDLVCNEVAGISGEPGAWRVRTLSGEEIPAAAVVVATGTPAGTRRLLPADPGWDGLGPAVTAACLDLGVRHIRTRLTFGIDEPLYLSPHAPGGKLAPAGMGMVHVMRYGATSASADRARLEAFAASAGIAAGDIATSRFLPKMTVATALPTVGTGLAGRPPVAVEGTPGLFVAGDWAGPAGWLSDASLASGEQAGLLAARAVQPVARASLTAA